MTSVLSPLSILVVAGNWDTGGGRPSSMMAKFAVALRDAGASVRLLNGGSFDELAGLLGDGSIPEAAIVWAANVPNDLPKHRDVKAAYPHKLLVTTKRNNDEYSFLELANRVLLAKANLCIDFRREDDRFFARLFDPLGAVWCDHTDDVRALAGALKKRLDELRAFTRQGTRLAAKEPVPVPHEMEFFGLVKGYAEVFHKLVMPAEGVMRFLGNSSFRCMRGFPSVRDPASGKIFVSRRNVDKRFIGPDAFVAVSFDGSDISYWGEYKPSVDTPIQVRLYEALSNIHFMLHAHVYVDGAPFTKRQVPCGALEEVEEVLSLIGDGPTSRGTYFAAVNLRGHGCLIMANKPSLLRDLPFRKRPLPEILS